MKRLLSVLLLLTLAHPLSAFDLEIALGEDTANIDYRTESERFGFTGSDLHAGLFFNEDDDFALTAGFLVDGTPAGDQPLTFGLGSKLYYVDVDDADAEATALALGFGVRYYFPARMPMAVGGDAYFAPDITTFTDAEGLLDFRLRFELGILPSAAVFAGYRQFELDLKRGGDYELDDDVHIGISFQF